MSSNSVNKNQTRIITDLTKFKNGVTRQQMKTDAEKSIFDTLDENLDGKLDDKEQKGTVKGTLNGKEQLFVMIRTLSNGSMIVADSTGKEWVRTKQGKILNISKNYLAEENANRFYEIADTNSGLNSIRKMQKFLDTQINSSNITDFLDKYEKSKNGDSSIIDTVTSEFGASGTSEQKKVLDTIMQKLTAAAKKAGVSQADINKANTDFQKAYKAEYQSLSGKFRKTNPKDMEKAMDSLRGAIKVKQTGGTMSDTDAIKQFKELAKNEHNTAVKNYNTARNEEGWAAKAGDTICGWFGCTTRGDMYKKFGNNKAFVDALLNSKTEAEFKKIYEHGITTPDGKKILGTGVPFDANKLAARQKALGDYQHAVALDNTIKCADEALSFKNSDYWQMASKVRNNFGLKEDELNAIIESYAMQDGKSTAQINKQQKKEYLAKFLNDTKTNAAAELRNTSKGKTLEQMENDLNLITRSAFGTGDIGKDQMQFDENQMITGMITDAGFEIAGTIALQFIPGLGQAAVARLAASSAKWGNRAVKVTKMLSKAEKGLDTVKKFQTGQKFSAEMKTGVKTVSTTKKAEVLNKTAQVTSQMTNAGVATATVGISDLASKEFDLSTEEGRQKYEEAKKEVGKKILMNMSFAGVGAGSSMIAEKLAATYGIESSLAKEVAEEVMNAAGSYGVTKAAGDEYGSIDAFTDFASGLIISRISHVKGGKPTDTSVSAKQNTDATAPTSPSNIKPADTPAPETTKPQPKTRTGNTSENVPPIDTKEWRKVNIGDEEIEVPVTKNADGTDNIDFSQGRKLNDSGEYEYFDMTTTDDIMANGSNGEKQGFFSRLFGKKTPKEISQIDNKQLQKKVENTLKHYSCDLNDNIHHNSTVSPYLSNAITNKGSMVKTLNRSSDLNNISAHISTGEVCSVGNKLYVNENGNAVELKMSKEKFEQLFPSEESILMTEQLVGTDTCWAISAINSMTKNGYGRAQLFKALEELPDGSMVVHLKSGSVKDVVFPDGQPLPVIEASMGDNAAAGLSMIEQAILATARPDRNGSHAKRALSTVQLKPGQTMADIGFHDLITNACSLCYSGRNAMCAIFIPGFATKTNPDAVKIFHQSDGIRNCLENFNPKIDFLNAIWGNHQKTVINYDPSTQIVTFHEPYNIGAVDTQCSLDDFVKSTGSIVYYTTPKTPATIDIKPVSSNPIKSDKTSLNPESKPVKSIPKPQYEFQFEERTTQLRRGQFQPVAKTIEGNNIDAIISSDDGSIIIRKDGKETIIEVENGKSELIHETSTDTYLIITKDNNGNVTVKTSETGEIPDIEPQQTSHDEISESKAETVEPEIGTRPDVINANTPVVIDQMYGKDVKAMINPDGDVAVKLPNGVSKTYQLAEGESKQISRSVTVKKENGVVTFVNSKFENNSPNVSTINQSKPTSTNNTTESKNITPKAASNLAMPQGFREYGKIMGKRAIINSDNIVMREVNGSWKRLN